MTIKFVIYQVDNGFVLNITHGKKVKSYIFQLNERIKMYAYIDKWLDRAGAPQDEGEK